MNLTGELTMQHVSIYRVQMAKIGELAIENNMITSPETAAAACRQFLLHEYGGFMPDREVLGILWLNTKKVVSGAEVVSIGSLNAAIVHPREVFKSGILHNASAFIVFHNHPSGDPRPSEEDIKLTHRLSAAGDLIGIELVDHIILGNDYISLKAQGHI
ncbi:JAB domain-containing protein [Paenibacillus polymyxa]|uniref:JAB domain-containing protein n=1 Tax=Paenibacillus polymyxa TaxID=1406 RepID=UPI00111A8AB2|nr:JAB domain-containing protein [Paenibacillus polymyxa]QDA30250.1 DNA repair protein RadC [Paenibacillus polymyxa]